MPIGFILQGTYRTGGGRTLVWLIGKLDDGRTFLVEAPGVQPSFFVRAADVDACRAAGIAARPCDWTGLEGATLAEVSAQTPKDLERLRQRLEQRAVLTYEADVKVAVRFLVDRGIRSAVAIDGLERRPPPGVAVDVMFEAPALTPARWPFRPSILALDIETDHSASRILSIALVGAGADEVLFFGDSRVELRAPEGSVVCASQAELVRRFAERVRAIDPDVITGWNVIDFDFAVLARVAEAEGVPLALGRLQGETRVSSRGFWLAPTAYVPGRLVIDGLALLRDSFVAMDDYSLDAVAQSVLGEGKAIDAVSDRRDAITRMYEHDPAALVRYNRHDAALVLGILDKLGLVPLAVERSLLTGLPLDRAGAAIAAFERLYLSALHRRKIAAPTLERGGGDAAPTSGGLVLDSKPGLYSGVWVVDFKSLYPSVMRTFAIDPLGHSRPGDDPIVAPNGARFARGESILPQMLDALFPEREAAKADNNAIKSQAIKILMNSFYGVLGTPACRFHSSQIANAITSFGREILLWTKAHIEARGHEVLYGDTDSLFVRANSAPDADGKALVAEVNAALAAHLYDAYRVESRLELQLEAVYEKLWLQPLRDGEGGARKRYSGLLASGEIELVGLEAVRRDWTLLAKDAQRELVGRLFRGEPVEDYLRELVQALRAGRLDERLVYRKALRKPLEEYTASTPPHVAAAKKLGGTPPRLIEYVMTVRGPEPTARRSCASGSDAAPSPLDYEHYVDKQLRPVAEPVLAMLGLRFDRVASANVQLELF